MSFFYQRVQKILSDPEIRRMKVSIIHFDIPNFKLYNERNGFKKGDELLCEVARTIHSVFTAGTVARFSDDHFVVCDVTDEEDADGVVERVEQVFRRILLSEESTKRVRIKAGIYYLEDRYPEVGLACDHARLACNSIKERHDINYCIYDEMLRERLRKQQYVVDHIDEALQKEYIKIYYQPVIRVATGEICGYEALVRWVDPKVGFMSPADFIETLEQFHLIHKVDMYVVQKVCQDYRVLKQKGEPIVPVSINLSRLDFELCNVVDVIEAEREKMICRAIFWT